MSDQIEVQLEGTKLQVTAGFSNRFVDPSILQSLPALDVDGVESVEVSGRGPLWFYASVAARARDGVTVTAFSPELEGHVVLCRGSIPAGGVVKSQGAQAVEANADESAPVVSVEFQREPDGSKSIRVFPLMPGRKLGSGELASLDSALTEALGDSSAELIYWDGRGTTWLVASVARICRKLRPDSVIAVYYPSVAGRVIVWGDVTPGRRPGDVMPLPGRGSGSPCIVYGVVGDPNSGKSVFSWKLYLALQERKIRCQRLDADVRSPTALWMQSDMGSSLRDAQKVEWDDANDVPMLVRAIEGMRNSSLDLVLVDLPGGLHIKDRPQDAQRIPPGREALFAAIDRYVIVQKRDDIPALWRECVQAANADARFDHEVVSRLNAVPDPAGSGSGMWRPGPLRRETMEEGDPVIEMLADRIAAAVE